MNQAHRLIGKSAKYVFMFVCCAYVAIGVNWEPFFLLVGGIANAALSKVLKYTLRCPRPELSAKHGYGMPSSHSQSMCYFVHVLFSRRHLLTTSYWGNILILMIIAIYVFLASVWRIRAHLHSTSQTIAGTVLGIGFSFFWQRLETNVLLEDPAALDQLSHEVWECFCVHRLRHEYNTGGGPSASLKGFILASAIWIVFVYKKSDKAY